METATGTHAVVRGVPDSFDRAIKPKGMNEPIDLSRAREQHARYCKALEESGLTLIRIEADDRYPDCCFVEDTAVVVGEIALIANMAPLSRKGETQAAREALRSYKQIHELSEPATLDGGDVLEIGDTLFVGLSRRTNEVAVEQMGALLSSAGYRVVPVAVRDVLHLKTACTYLAGDMILYLPGHLDDRAFARYRRIAVPQEEAPAANCIAVNGRVVIPSGAPQTKARIEAAGLEALELDISESLKAAGRLTCSSIIF